MYYASLLLLEMRKLTCLPAYPVCADSVMSVQLLESRGLPGTKTILPPPLPPLLPLCITHRYKSLPSMILKPLP